MAGRQKHKVHQAGSHVVYRTKQMWIVIREPTQLTQLKVKLT